jgi:hypothetical protein
MIDVAHVRQSGAIAESPHVTNTIAFLPSMTQPGTGAPWQGKLPPPTLDPSRAGAEEPSAASQPRAEDAVESPRANGGGRRCRRRCRSVAAADGPAGADSGAVIVLAVPLAPRSSVDKGGLAALVPPRLGFRPFSEPDHPPTHQGCGRVVGFGSRAQGSRGGTRAGKRRDEGGSGGRINAAHSWAMGLWAGADICESPKRAEIASAHVNRGWRRQPVRGTPGQSPCAVAAPT